MIDQIKFFSELSEHQISAQEFFGHVLLESLERNFGFGDVVISYFDTKGQFLSWVSHEGILLDGPAHPYRNYVVNDVIRHAIYQEAVRDQLTYFNVNPRLYQSTAVINQVDYNHCGYVRFLEDNFKAHYSVTMAFGINAYIQIAFLKNEQQGDFTAEEIEALNKIYIYIANSYKNFKKYEQAQIVSMIQREIIASGEKAYLIADDFLHILSYNETAHDYLGDVFGLSTKEPISSTKSCSWLPFILGTEADKLANNDVSIRQIKDYQFKISRHDQKYSNGIVDRYYWITLSKDEPKIQTDVLVAKLPLTQAEQRVVHLLYSGLTYKAIADELVVSYHTVKKHVQNIYTKCGVKSRFQLCKWVEEMSK